MRPRKPSAPNWLDRLLWVAGIVAGAWLLVLMGTSCVRAGELKHDIAVVASHARQAQPVLRITQSGKRTTGSVIQADAHGTWILTCRHGRRASDPWVAGPLSGSYTRVAPKDDLALLWTRDRWDGPVYEISRYDVDLPVRFIQHETLPRALPVGCPLWEHPGRRHLGESGTPLLCEGRIAGVLWGVSPTSSLYVRRDSIVRFLKEVRRD